MTNMSADGGWGARALGDREARKRRTTRRLVAAVILLPVVLALVEVASRGFAPGDGSSPGWVHAARGFGIVALLGYGLWRARRDYDEVEWRRSVNVLATIGAGAVILNLLADTVEGAGAGYPALRHHLFLASVAAGFAVYAWQRWRR